MQLTHVSTHTHTRTQLVSAKDCHGNELRGAALHSLLLPSSSSAHNGGISSSSGSHAAAGGASIGTDGGIGGGGGGDGGGAAAGIYEQAFKLLTLRSRILEDPLE